MPRFELIVNGTPMTVEDDGDTPLLWTLRVIGVAGWVAVGVGAGGALRFLGALVGRVLAR